MLDIPHIEKTITGQRSFYCNITKSSNFAKTLALLSLHCEKSCLRNYSVINMIYFRPFYAITELQ